jgi:hypothetical protein
MWRKPIRSMHGGNCFECEEWRTSTHSDSGHCVECSETNGGGGNRENGIQIRDSKDPDGAILRFDRDTWTRFINDYK